MIEKIYGFIREYNMLENCGHVIAGVSGGADSVCLLTVLCRLIEQYALPVTLMAVHVNHGIRGDEAARDEAFVRELCAGLGVSCVCRFEDVPAAAARDGLTEEEAGRRARYAVFAGEAERLQQQDGQAVRIAVAHHMDDQGETVLMHLLRGSSLKGMGGIAPVQGAVIRPLLCVTRREIEDHLEACGQAFVTDSTNGDNTYTRNRIRNELFPYIRKQFNPNITQQLSSMAQDLREVQQYLEEQSGQLEQTCVVWQENGEKSSVRLALSCFEAQPVLARQVVHRVLERLAGGQKDLYRKHVEMVMALSNRTVGKTVHLPYGICAHREYDSVFLHKQQMQAPNQSAMDADASGSESAIVSLSAVRHGPLTVPIDWQVYFRGRLVTVQAVHFELLAGTALESLKNTHFSENNDYTKYFDYDKMRDNLCIRFRQEGDRMTVYRNGDSKKLKKELIDRKIRQEDRNKVLLVTQGNNVLWAAGIRRSEAYSVETSTARCLRISIVIREDK